MDHIKCIAPRHLERVLRIPSKLSFCLHFLECDSIIPHVPTPEYVPAPVFVDSTVPDFIRDSPQFSIVPGERTKWSDFASAFHSYNRVNHKYKLTTKNPCFPLLGLEVTRINLCCSCKSRYVKGCCDKYIRGKCTTQRVIEGLKMTAM